MPRGPEGEYRPADVNSCAFMVMQISTGQIEDKKPGNQQKGGKAGGPARAKGLSPERRSEIAKKAANARWNKNGARN